MTTIDLLKKTKASWGSIRSADAEEKNRLLLAMAESLETNCADILRDARNRDGDTSSDALYSAVMVSTLVSGTAEAAGSADLLSGVAGACPAMPPSAET